MGRRRKGNASVTFRIPKELVDKFEEYTSDLMLDRNLIVAMLMARYLSDLGVVADD